MENRESRRLGSLRGPAEFALLKAKGRQIRCTGWLLIRYLRHENSNFRLGLTLPKYVGTAVVRNRLRRWCREHFRRHLRDGEALGGLDVIVIFFRTSESFYRDLTHDELDAQLERGLGRIFKPEARSRHRDHA